MDVGVEGGRGGHERREIAGGGSERERQARRVEPAQRLEELRGAPPVAFEEARHEADGVGWRGTQHPLPRGFGRDATGHLQPATSNADALRVGGEGGRQPLVERADQGRVRGHERERVVVEGEEAVVEERRLAVAQDRGGQSLGRHLARENRPLPDVGRQQDRDALGVARLCRRTREHRVDLRRLAPSRVQVSDENQQRPVGLDRDAHTRRPQQYRRAAGHQQLATPVRCTTRRGGAERHERRDGEHLHDGA